MAMEAVPVRLKNVGIVLCLIVPLQLFAKTSEFTPTVELEHTFSDNITLVNQFEPEIDEDVDIFRFKLDWNREESIWSSRLTSEYESIHYHSIKSDADDYLTFNFDTRFFDRAKRFTVGVIASQSQTYSSFLRNKVIDNIHITDNVTENRRYTGFFEFNNQISSQVKVGLRASKSQVDFSDDNRVLPLGDRIADSYNDSYRLTFSDPNTRKQRWYVTAQHFENRYKDPTVIDTYRSNIEAAVNIPFERRWNILLMAGKIDDEFSQLVRENNGDYFSGGLSYWAPSKLKAEVVFGPKYSGALIEYFVSSRTAFKAKFVDRELGVLPEQTLDISWKTRSKKTEFSLNKIESVETYATEFLIRENTDGSFEFLPPEILLLDIPPVDPNTNEIVTNEFILDKTHASFRYFGRSYQWDTRILGGKRSPVGLSTSIQKFYGGSSSYRYQLNRRSSLILETMRERSRYQQVDVESSLQQHIIRYQHIFSKQFSMQWYLLHLNQEVSNRNIDIIENRAGVILSSQF